MSFANTLLQGLDLSVASGQQITLSFDWTYGGEQAAQDENFLVALGDGSGNYFAADGSNGFLINPSSYGTGHFSVVLDPTFNNAGGWSLELQLNAAFDGYGSYIQIDNVTLVSAITPPVVTPPATATPIPLSFAHWLSIIALLLAGIVTLQRKEKTLSGMSA